MSALHVIDIKICTTKKKYVPVFQVEVKFVRLYYAVFIVYEIKLCATCLCFIKVLLIPAFILCTGN